MSEITINKNNKSISFTHNNIAFSQFGIADEILDLITDLQNQLQQKENIIKEVREYIDFMYKQFEKIEDKELITNRVIDIAVLEKILGILDKGE